MLKNIQYAIDSINEHGADKMDEHAKNVWNILLENIKNINFKKIWCQYSDSGQHHIFISFRFNHDVFVDMTKYIDSDYIIFSVCRNNECWMSDGLPDDIFFQRLCNLPNIIDKQTWD